MANGYGRWSKPFAIAISHEPSAMVIVWCDMPRARKRFGQNFLEPAWVNKVIRAIDPKPDEVFVEIGPGRGALTRPLAAHAKAVVAYEIDRDLAAELEATAPPNVRVIKDDFLATTDYRLPTPDSRRPTPDSRL